MALTNLTFGDGTNKALLCSMPGPLRSLVLQLQSISEELCQVAASVLRNLSWHADAASKRNLRSAGAVQMLTQTMLTVKKEPTLKSLLSALWNFSAHCPENKEDICAIQGALQLLVWSLNFRSPSKTLAVIENGGGVLRNVSSHVAIRSDYRIILRKHGCLSTLLKHLRSPSLTVVSNACGTLWNLSAHCLEDQKILCSLGAIEMLKNLVHSKHKMISLGSAAALKNLLSSTAFTSINGLSTDPYTLLTSSWMGRNDSSFNYNSADRPGLHVRRQRALQRELQSRYLSETYDTSSPLYSPMTSPQSQDVAQPFTRSLQTKTSVNISVSKPPPYPINFSDVIYHSDSDILNKSKILLNPSAGTQNQLANLSLEHERMDELFGLEDNFYSPGMFLSCHESIATGGQDTAADFLPCNSQNFDGSHVQNDSGWAMFYHDDVVTHVTHPSYFRDLPIIENVTTVQGLEEEMIRLEVDDREKIVELDEGPMENVPMLRSPSPPPPHHHHQLLPNPNVYHIQKYQGNNLLGHPMVFDELPSTEQLFNTCEKNDIVSFQFNPVVEVLPWQHDSSKHDSISEGFVNKRPVQDHNINSPRKSRKSFLRPPTNYNLSKFNLNISKLLGDEEFCNDIPLNQQCFQEQLCDHDRGTRLHDSNVRVKENIHEILPESSSPLDPNLTIEHELALQENANLVLSVLERTSLTESNLSSDIHLLENETISLISDSEAIDELPMVSNFFNSVKFHDGTAKEDSLVSGTEQTINICNSVNSEDEVPSIANDIEHEVKRRPRIVKPGTAPKPSIPTVDKDVNNEPKVIRGRRKVLYPGKPKTPLVSDKRVVSASPSRHASSNFQKDSKDDKRFKVINSAANNFNLSKLQAQTKTPVTGLKDKLNKTKEEKKISKISSTQRPQSAFIRNPGSSTAAPEEAIKQAKLKSYSLPPGQKPPTSKDCQGAYMPQKSKPKLVSKQDTFIKLAKPGINSSNDNLQKQDQKQAPRSTPKGKPRKISAKIQNSGSSLGPSTSSNEKITSLSSSNAIGKHSNHSNMSKSGSINSITSSRCSSAPKIPPKMNNTPKQTIKPKLLMPANEDNQPKVNTDHRTKYAYNDALNKQDANRLQKSSTYDKLKEFFGEESNYKSDNTNSDYSEVRPNHMESDSLEKACKDKLSKVENGISKQSQVSKIPNIAKKPPPDKRTSPVKKEMKTTRSFNNKALDESFQEKKKIVENGIKHHSQDAAPNGSIIRDRGVSAPSNKSKALSTSISASTRKEISVMNAKNLSKTLPSDNPSKIQSSEDDPHSKSKRMPGRGFSFWKKQPTKSKEAEDPVKSALPVPNSQSKKATNNKSKISPKAESPIRKKVLGWFKKGSETHTIIAEKNKALISKEDLTSDMNFNKHLDFLVDDIQLAETLITTLDTKNGNNSPIRAAVVQPFNYHNLDGVTSLQSSDTSGFQNPPKFTKTELLLARHRSSRLASDSRSSMAMSIDSLKVNSLDSFQNTDRSFSDVPSEITEKDDLSSVENVPLIAPT